MPDTAKLQRPPTCAECDAASVVGWSQPPIWLCLKHFDERMKVVGEAIHALRSRPDA